MNRNHTVSCAIAAILSGVTDMAHADETDPSQGGLNEVIVTAQRRAESTQSVPITVQVMTAETLSQLNVSTFQDFLLYLPNVSTATNGPGQNNIYMRGLSVGGNYSQGSGGVGSFPNVAVYLDEQSAQVPGRNLDIFAADIERIEVLEGPQGTLFGSGSEAGVVRFITNKPKLGVTEGKVDASYGITKSGDPSTTLEAVLNVPLIADKLAVRGVLYNDSRGGYIDNVPGTFARSDSDLSIGYAGNCDPQGNCHVPANSPVLNNNAMVEKNFNPLTYKGARVQAAWKVNDDWDVLASQSFQRMNADGVFYETPNGSNGETLPDLSVVVFNPSYNKDWFRNSALTVSGRIHDLSVVYAGSYLTHNADQVQDYTNYARGVYTDYYQCIPGATPAEGVCYSPSQTWHERLNDTHNSQELRFSTPDDRRLRVLGGVFWEKYQIKETIDFLYKTAPGFAPIQPPADSTAYNPDVRNDNVSFFDDITRGYTQKAAFVSLDYDIIPDKLSITAGTRYYRFSNTEVGSQVSSFGCYVGTPTTDPCTTYSGVNLDSQNMHSTYSGFRSRANLKWNLTDEVLLYYTWSQGFRPGGFNRSSADHELAGGYIFTTPLSFAPDSLINNELGWKSQWLGRRLQLNGAVYQEDWKNVQTSFFDPASGLGNLTFIANGPNYRIRGIEMQLIARPIPELTLTGAASYNDSQQQNSPFLIATKGPLAGQPITSIPNAYGDKGSPTAQSPDLQFNLRARYDYHLGDYNAYWQAGGQYQSHSFTGTGKVQSFRLPAFSTYAASFGVGKDAWMLNVYGENLTDKRTSLFTSTYQWIRAETVNRPRTITLNVTYDF